MHSGPGRVRLRSIRTHRTTCLAVVVGLFVAACGDSVVETGDSVLETVQTNPLITEAPADPSPSGVAPTTVVVATTVEPLPTPSTVPVPRRLEATSLSATVSSQLPDSTVGDTYGPENLLDDDATTAWNHCGSECTDSSSDSARNGVGQMITLVLEGPFRVVGLSIENGYQKPDDAIFFGNNRIARATLQFGDGSTEAIALTDGRGSQSINFAARSVASVTLRVDDVYLGDGTFNDLAVSEIGLWVIDSDNAPEATTTARPAGHLRPLGSTRTQAAR